MLGNLKKDTGFAAAFHQFQLLVCQFSDLGLSVEFSHRFKSE